MDDGKLVVGKRNVIMFQFVTILGQAVDLSPDQVTKKFIHNHF